MTVSEDTIFALASAPGQAGLAVIRVSGDKALESFASLTRKPVPAPKQAVYSAFHDPETGDVLDRGVALYFQNPKSFTGEDVVEYTLHGSRAVIHRFLEVLSQCGGHRMAEPGEFTKRAFLNGKLDLTAAEAVADLIHAETEAQRVIALNQLGGALETLYRGWADRLARLLAHQEADIEFPDEDMPDGIDDRVRVQIESLLDEMRAHLDDNRKGERLRDGMQIAIIGAPNAGKSSLLNWLAQREAAIVSDLAGTTRDIVDVSLNLGGFPVVLSDTAGLRDDYTDTVEAEGIRRAIARASAADLKIAVFDRMVPADPSTVQQLDTQTLIVLNKTDLSGDAFWDKTDNKASGLSGHDMIEVSLKDARGLEDFLGLLTKRVAEFFHGITDAPLLTRERHRHHLMQCTAALEGALSADLPELAAEDIRQALLSIGRMTGRVDVEQLLDIVFRDFCIGK